MARRIFSRLRRRGNRKDKNIVSWRNERSSMDTWTDAYKPGQILDIDIAPFGDSHDPPIWHSVDRAVHIPSNERNLLSLTLARKMGVVAFDEQGIIVDNTVELQWKRREPFPKNILYGCRARFVIQEDLPCEIMFGKHDPLDMLPEYPSPFEGAPREVFDQSYGFPKPLAKPRTNSWAIVRKSFSWGSDKSKAKSTKSSSDLRMSPVPPTAKTSDYHKSYRPEVFDDYGGSQVIHSGMPFSEVTSNLSNSAAEGEETTVTKNRDIHSAEIGTALATIPSDESAELREANRISNDQNPSFRADTIPFRHGTESQKDDSEMASKPNFSQEIPSTRTLANSETPEIASLQPCNSNHELQQSHLEWPGANGMFVEPAESVGRFKNTPHDPETVSLEGERKSVENPADRAVIQTHILPEDGDESVALHQPTTARTLENAKEEISRIWTQIQSASDLEAWKSIEMLKQEPDWAPSESNDSGVAFRRPEIGRNSMQSIEVKPSEPLRIGSSQSADHGSQETTDPRSMRTDNFEPNLQYFQYINDPGEPGVPASQEAINVLDSDEHLSSLVKAPTELERGATSQTQADALDPTIENFGHLVTEQSTRLLAKSRSSLDYSVATERPAQSETTTPLVKPDFMSGENTVEGQSTVPEVKQHSERSRRSTNSRSKKPLKRRGKAPRIRAWKGDPSQKADLVPAEGADEYWEYDEELKAYYHIDSDTGSTFWYEDSSDESEA